MSGSPLELWPSVALVQPFSYRHKLHASLFFAFFLVASLGEWAQGLFGYRHKIQMCTPALLSAQLAITVSWKPEGIADLKPILQITCTQGNRSCDICKAVVKNLPDVPPQLPDSATPQGPGGFDENGEMLRNNAMVLSEQVKPACEILQAPHLTWSPGYFEYIRLVQMARICYPSL